MTHIAGFERDQLLLLPEAVDDYVDADNPVRLQSGLPKERSESMLGSSFTVYLTKRPARRHLQSR